MKSKIISVNKKDTNGLFSGKYRKQIFKDKKDKIKIIQKREQKYLLNESQ